MSFIDATDRQTSHIRRAHHRLMPLP